LTGTIKVEGN